MAVLRVREYGRIVVGERFDPNRSPPTITAAQRSRLERFSEAHRARTKTTLFQYGPRQTLVAQNLVGVIDLGKDQIEILPKIEGVDDARRVRRNLAEMIAVTRELQVREGHASRMEQPSDTLLEVLVRLFCRRLWQEVHKGLFRGYEPRSETLSVLRGRLSIERQVARNAVRPERLDCDYDEFTEDTVLNRVLKCALTALQRVSKSASNRRAIAELLFCFGDVADIGADAALRTQPATDRTSARFADLLAMARLFLAGSAPDVVAGRGTGFALLFDMAALFEEYIGQTARRWLQVDGVRVRLQGPPRHLARRADGRLAFDLVPDIVGETSAGVAWIVDTKWKRLDVDAHRDGVGSADMYQMNAYAGRFDSPEVILLYPHHGGLGAAAGIRGSYGLSTGMLQASTRRVHVATVELADLATVPAQLRKLVESASRPALAASPSSRPRT